LTTRTVRLTVAEPSVASRTTWRMERRWKASTGLRLRLLVWTAR
jgi:hypothetical protein